MSDQPNENPFDKIISVDEVADYYFESVREDEPLHTEGIRIGMAPEEEVKEDFQGWFQSWSEATPDVNPPLEEAEAEILLRYRKMMNNERPA